MSKSEKHLRRSTKQLAIRGVVFNWMGRGSSFVITFFLTPYLVHTLGDERYGLWSIVMSLTSYYGMADLGLNGAGIKYIAEYHARGDRESMNKIIVTSLCVYSGLACVVGMVCLFIAWAFPFLFEVSVESEATMRAIVVLTGGTVVLRLFGQVFNAAVNALQRHDIANAAAVSQQIAQALAIVFVLSRGGGLLSMAWATLLVAGLGRVTRLFVARRLIPGISLSWRYFDLPTLKRLFHFSLMTSATRVARRMAERLGPILVGAIAGPASVAYYDIAERLTNKLGDLGQSINGVVDPLASRLDASGDRSALIKMMSLSTRLILALDLYVVTMLIVVGHDFISLWIGPEYAERSYPVLCLLALAHAARVSGNPLRSTLRGTGRLTVLLRTSILEVVAMGLTAPLLILNFGLNGMATAVLSTQVLIGLFVLPYATCQALECSTSRYLRDAWLPALGVAGVSLVTILALVQVFTPSRTLHIVGEFAVVGVVAGVSAFFICLDRDRRHDVLNALATRWAGRAGTTAAVEHPVSVQP